MQLSLNKLSESLHFLHVDELRSLCKDLYISPKGKKVEMIYRILHFMKTNEELNTPPFPKISCAERGKKYEITPQALMLKGAYKNDLETRLFFKNLIGNHFHFTAFGIDWLNKKWMEANPPTYKEFADMWQQEYAQRKLIPAMPKAEWAYINFVQRYLLEFPKGQKEDILAAWNLERNRHKDYVKNFLIDTHKFSPTI